MTDLKDVSKMTDSERMIEEGIDAKRRADNCLADIKNVLKRWGCTIDPIIQISSQGIGRSYAVVPTVKREVS